MTRHLKPSGGFELAAWYFMRVSGLILVLLALGHLFITHILNNVENVNYEFVAGRWADPRTGVLWRLWDLTMINLAVLHGFNGLRQILDEYVTRPNRRVLLRTLIWTGAIFLMTIGSYAILMFEKDQAYINQKRASRRGELVQRQAEASPASSFSAAPAGLASAESP
ncbi:MAG: succinate dehydrogenase hydrophobic membrane anchor subunit [Isosphaeraceae bacterium]